MIARELSGKNIGKAGFFYIRPTDGQAYLIHDVTMITHKKNGNVRVRWDYNNKERELKPTWEIRENSLV